MREDPAIATTRDPAPAGTRPGPVGSGGPGAAGWRLGVQPWALEAGEVARACRVEVERGLASADVAGRRARFGGNALRRIRSRSAFRLLLDQMRSLVVALLAAAAAVALAFGEYVEAGAIAVVLLINTSIGFWIELRAVRSVEALRHLGIVRTRVRRDGRDASVEASDLVVGDVVVLEGGDVVTADLRLVEASGLEVDESTLTGESVPVRKQTDAVARDTPLAERCSMLYKGSSLTRGAAVGIVVAVGVETELGKISRLVAEAEDARTPLEKRLDELSAQLVVITLVIAAVIVVVGWLAGRDTRVLVETAIALAVATIPEGLPIVATLALARGMARMARRNALVQSLSAVETLGATSVVFADKTGTLTENRMVVEEVVLAEEVVRFEQREKGPVISAGRIGGPLREALEVFALCSDAELAAPTEDAPPGTGSGDPLEIALLSAARAGGIERPELLREQPELREVAFDPDTAMMATFHRHGDRVRVAIKGAPERVLEHCSGVLHADGEIRELSVADRDRWSDRVDVLASKGLRVLALADRTVDDEQAAPYEDAVLIGLVGIHDPPRLEARAAIAACREAGVRVVMVTGDQPATAWSIAGAVGLVDGSEPPEVVHGRELADDALVDEALWRRLKATSVMARFSPAQKLRLIALHQDDGDIVAMTGDGVNDAPALQKADIGVAMGKRGTAVAREASDMVLQDDDFGTIVAAIEEGRTIFRNLRAFVVYLLSCNVSEILVVALASFASAPLPILPLQILFLNLITDVFPALALGAGESEEGVLKRPPRPADEPVLGRREWRSIAGYGALLTVSVLSGFALALGPLGWAADQAVTVSFLTLAFGQVVHVFDMHDRSSGGSPWRNEVTRNPWVWAAIALCCVLTLGALFTPPIAAVLSLRPPGAQGWALVVAGAILPSIAFQLLARIRRPESQSSSPILGP